MLSKLELVIMFGVFISLILVNKIPSLNNMDYESDFEVNENTFYVAQNQNGASNNNNGLFPVYTGDKNGPFKDLNFNKDKLPLKGGFRIILREGNYKVPDNGLHIFQNGDNKERVVIKNYESEKVVIDGNDNDFGLKLDGSFITVQNLDIRNSKVYNIQVKSRNVEILGNKIHDSYEDNIKILSTAEDIVIRDNEIFDFAKEGIDVFGSNVEITNNYIHSNKKLLGSSESHCFFAKGGSKNVVFEKNKCENIESSWGGAVILGGVSGTKYTKKYMDNSFYPQGMEIKVLDNEFTNIKGGAASFIECISCEFSRNNVRNVEWGLKFSSGPNYDVKEAIVTNNEFIINNDGFIALIEKPTSFKQFDYNRYEINKFKYIIRGKSIYNEHEEESIQVISNDQQEISIEGVKEQGFEQNSIFQST